MQQGELKRRIHTSMCARPQKQQVRTSCPHPGHRPSHFKGVLPRSWSRRFLCSVSAAAFGRDSVWSYNCRMQHHPVSRCLARSSVQITIAALAFVGEKTACWQVWAIRLRTHPALPELGDMSLPSHQSLPFHLVSLWKRLPAWKSF